MSEPSMALWGPKDNEEIEAARGAITEWRRGLSTGDQAELRRCHSVSEISFTAPYARLYHRPRPRWWVDERRLPIVAGLLAHARLGEQGQSVETSLVDQMASSPEGGSKARFSSLRFRRLAQRSDPDEVFHGLLRVVRMLNRQVGPAHLAEAAYHWNHERHPRQFVLRYFEKAPQDES